MVNKQIIVGYLGNDPEQSATAGGTSVSKFRVATSRYVKKGDEKTQKTEWHNVEAYGGLADVCNEYLRKGSLVFILGETQHQEWEKKDDSGKGRRTVVVADEMRMLDRKD